MPSSHQWLPVAATTTKVRNTWIGPSQRHPFGASVHTPQPTSAAHPQWIDGMAANWSETPVPTGPYTDSP